MLFLSVCFSTSIKRKSLLTGYIYLEASMALIFATNSYFDIYRCFARVCRDAAYLSF